MAAMNEAVLQYGRCGLRVRLDPSWRVTRLRKRPMPVLPDPVAAIDAALAGGADLSSDLATAVAASGDRSLAVIPEGPYVIPVPRR
jgi:hypothetical protein